MISIADLVPSVIDVLNMTEKMGLKNNNTVPLISPLAFKFYKPVTMTEIRACLIHTYSIKNG